jgi:hypothetical protein
MKQLIRAFVAIGAVGVLAQAAPVKASEQSKPKVTKLTKAKMASITAGKITQTNGGGHVPKGEANGIPARNPAGHAPPGQN